MSTLVTNCPRCNAKHITFDCYSYVFRGNDGPTALLFELFCQCRACHLPSIFLTYSDERRLYDIKAEDITNSQLALNDVFDIGEPISLKDQIPEEIPEHLPPIIEERYREGCACLGINCFNASVTMFRLCLDLIVKDFEKNHENCNPKGLLGNKLKYLFEQGYLPKELDKLSNCIKEYGNEGAHDGVLEDQEDALDIKDFTYELLNKVYTQPKRIELAMDRQEKRRNNN